MSAVPPMQRPPEDWPMEKRLRSYRKWVEQQGGIAHVSDGAPEGILDILMSLHCPLCEGTPEVTKKVRNYFNPPLPLPETKGLTEKRANAIFKEYVAILAVGHFLMETCKHRPALWNLRKLRKILEEEVEAPGRGNFHFQLMMDCPDCQREFEMDDRKYGGDAPMPDSRNPPNPDRSWLN